jgi:hypothetical protein
VKAAMKNPISLLWIAIPLSLPFVGYFLHSEFNRLTDAKPAAECVNIPIDEVVGKMHPSAGFGVELYTTNRPHVKVSRVFETNKWFTNDGWIVRIR